MEDKFLQQLKKRIDRKLAARGDSHGRYFAFYTVFRK